MVRRVGVGGRLLNVQKKQYRMLRQARDLQPIVTKHLETSRINLEPNVKQSLSGHTDP